MIVIRPAGIAEVLDNGFNLARRHYRPLLIAAAWGIVPPTVLQAIVSALVFTRPEQGAAIPILIGLSALLSVSGTVLASMAVTIGCARLLEAGIVTVDVRPSALYRAAFRRLRAFILLAIVVLIASIPLLLVFPLGVFVYVRWLVSWVALLVEETGPLASLARSWELTRGSWWHTLVIGLAATLIVGVLNFLVTGVFQAVGGMIAFVLGATVIGTILTGLGGAVAGPLTEPFSAAVLVVLYYELRARREGFDLEQRARHLASNA